jgi:AcrR family transcriptional regulator
MEFDITDLWAYVNNDRTVRSSTGQPTMKAAVSIHLAEPPTDSADNAKRRQIMTGAREVFLAQGFDAASMGEIARTAGVSKGTLYVYFDSKEQLFQAIATEECTRQAEQVFSLDPGDHDVEAVLTRLGCAYFGLLSRPAAMPALRTVISIAERMPEVGRQFYEAGPARGIATLRAYLESQVAAGILAVEDCELAAAQFLDSCQSTWFKQLLFNFADPPSDARVAQIVGAAVHTFMAAYRRRD